MSVHESKSKFTSRLSLIWETEMPSNETDRQSPHFTFKNCEWYLKLQQSGKHIFRIFMLPVNEQENIPSYTLKLYIQNTEKVLLVEGSHVSKPSGHICGVSISALQKHIIDNTFTIICVFDDEVSNSTELSGLQEQQSIQSQHTKSLLSGIKLSESLSSMPKDKIFSLENISKDLESLLDNQILPDVELMVEETSIPCHRAILAARSKVFAAMFQHEMTESTSGALDIKDIDLSTLKAFLKYLYSGKIPDDLTGDMLVKLFKTGDKYKVQALSRVCSIEMMKNINEENYLSYLSLAEAHKDQEFKDAVAEFIVKTDSLIKGPQWIQFSAENPTLAAEVTAKMLKNKK